MSKMPTKRNRLILLCCTSIILGIAFLLSSIVTLWIHYSRLPIVYDISEDLKVLPALIVFAIFHCIGLILGILAVLNSKKRKSSQQENTLLTLCLVVGIIGTLLNLVSILIIYSFIGL